MRRSVHTAVAAIICGLSAAMVLTDEATAGPVGVARSGVELSSPVEKVYYRRRYRRYGRRYYYDPTGAAVAGAALGIMGAGIAAATAPRYYPVYPAYPAYPAYPVYPAYPDWGW